MKKMFLIVTIGFVCVTRAMSDVAHAKLVTAADNYVWILDKALENKKSQFGQEKKFDEAKELIKTRFQNFLEESGFKNSSTLETLLDQWVDGISCCLRTRWTQGGIATKLPAFAIEGYQIIPTQDLSDQTEITSVSALSESDPSDYSNCEPFPGFDEDLVSLVS